MLPTHNCIKVAKPMQWYVDIGQHTLLATVSIQQAYLVSESQAAWCICDCKGNDAGLEPAWRGSHLSNADSAAANTDLSGRNCTARSVQAL